MLSTKVSEPEPVVTDAGADGGGGGAVTGPAQALWSQTYHVPVFRYSP